MISKEDKIKNEIELLEKIKGANLTSEEIEQIKKKYINPIPKNIELRDGEVDYRNLSEKDITQLMLREIKDIRQQLIFQNQITNDLVMGCYAIIKAMGKDPFKEISQICLDAEGKVLNE